MALALIKYLDLKSPPSTDIAQKLSNVRVVELTGLDGPNEMDLVSSAAGPSIQEFLSILAKVTTPYTLHVRYHLTEHKEDLWILRTFFARDGHGGYHPPAFEPITYEFSFSNLPSFEPEFDQLWVAYCLRSVVHFARHLVLGPDGRHRTSAEIASSVGSQALDAILLEASRNPPRLGRLYLCDIPGQVLTPGEIASAVDIKEVALRKLYDRGCRTRARYRGGWLEVHLKPSPSWEVFRSVIKLVEAGFRPSVADLKEGRKSVFYHPAR